MLLCLLFFAHLPLLTDHSYSTGRLLVALLVATVVPLWIDRRARRSGRVIH